jgi:hypothetical protein
MSCDFRPGLLEEIFQIISPLYLTHGARCFSKITPLMSSTTFLRSPSKLHPADSAAAPLPHEPADRAAIAALLAPVYEAALDSSSLIASRHPVVVQGVEHEIPKFLLLGERGGGKPIRIGLFAGFEPGNADTVLALTRLLLDLKLSPALTRDYALLAYPVVHLRGFDAEPVPLGNFEQRLAKDSADADVQFFQGELRRWAFDGLLSIRTDAKSPGFYASVRSKVIAEEVVEPALAAAASALPLATQAVKVRPGDRYARAADYAHGRLSAPAEVRPYPFEVELFAPRTQPVEEQVSGLFVAVTEILRHYRAFISHASDL